MQQRIAIWAAVSSRPQAEKDSIPDQLDAGRTFVAARKGILVAELIVPGMSRSYPTIAEATQGMGAGNAYEQLLALLHQQAIDLLWCRALDRIGRTDPIIAEVQWRCQQAGVLVWSEQMPPTGQATGDLYLSAIERAGAQKEVMEIKRRSHYGMNARARRGYMMATSHVPFGYRAGWEGRRRIAVVDEAEAPAFRWMVESFLSRSMTDEQIYKRLAELFPHRRWNKSSIRSILRNPFYVGIIVRNSTGPDGQPLHIEAQGLHQPLLDKKTWDEVQRLLDMRAAMSRPPSKSMWSGILVCDYCGRVMYSRREKLKGGDQVYHHCRNFTEKKCQKGNYVTEPLVTRAMVSYLQDLYRKHSGDLAALLDEATHNPIPDLEKQRDALLQRRDRLTMLYQTDRITLDEFDAQRARLSKELDVVDAEITTAVNRVEARERQEATAGLLRTIIPTLEQRLARVDPAEANRWLRGIFAEIRIRDKQVVGVRLC